MMLLGKYLILGKMSKCSQVTECKQHSLNYQGHQAQTPRVRHLPSWSLVSR